MDSRFTREILTRESMRTIANKISERINRNLSTVEISDLFAFTRSLAAQNWNTSSVPDIRLKLARNFIESRFTNEGRAKISNDIVDVHEIMKAHIGTSDQEPDFETVNNVDEDGNPIDLKAGTSSVPAVTTAASSLGSLDNIGTIDKILNVASIGNLATFMGKSDDSSFQQLVNPQAAHRMNYIMLDSRYRDLSQDTQSGGIVNFTWNFLANSSANTQGGVNSLGNVQQLVSIMCGDLRIPFQNNALINAYKRVSLLINEFGGQSYIGQEGRKFHFIFKTELDGNMIECKALMDGKGVFDFAKPITQLDTFTVSFSCPLEPMVFDMDRMLMSVAYTATARLVSTIPHKLQTGDQVYVSNFTTADPATDNAVITLANNVNGFNVYVVDPVTIELQGLDLSVVTAPISPLNIQVYFGSKRVFIPLQLKYISASVQNAKN